MSSFHERVIQIIQQIPPGSVATYGQVAALAGSPRAALMVGQILRRQTQAADLPWQRVINKEGRISIVNIEFPASLQAELLRAEGIDVTERNRSFYVDLRRYGWKGA